MQQSNKKGKVLQRWGVFFPKSYSIYKKMRIFFLTAFLELFTHSQAAIAQKHHSEIGFKTQPPPLRSIQKNRLEPRHVVFE